MGQLVILREVEKHGLDFEDAAEVFESPMIIALDARYAYEGERWIEIGLLEHRVVYLIYTDRNAGTIRIISKRKALRHEKHRYEDFLRNRLGTG